MFPDEGDRAGRDRYELLRRLRRSERRIRAIRRRWRAFREDPDPEALARVRRQLDRAADEIDRLARALAAPSRRETAGRTTSRAGRRSGSARPSPRDLVEAGRELEAAIGEALRDWAGTRRAPESAALERLIRNLEEATSHAETLAAALEPLGPANVIEAIGGGADLPDPTRVARAHALPERASLDALLSELRAEWAEIRRHPTSARAVTLGETLEAARLQASSLLALAISESPLADPEALRYLGGAADAVRFRPYRDEATGTYNDGGFRVAARVELDRCRRYGRPLGLILLRLDPGETGRLRPVLGAIRGLLRDYDVVGRVAETELALGLPESDARGTRRIAARLLRALDAAGHRRALARLDYALFPDDGDDVEALLAAARRVGS